MVQAVDESLADSPAGQYNALQGISLNLSTTFESWEPECMASASIAQVRPLKHIQSPYTTCYLGHNESPPCVCKLPAFNASPKSPQSSTWLHVNIWRIMRQVHGAVLTRETIAWLGWRWRLGPDVVLKVQHRDMRALMDSDVRNLGRLCAFVKGSLPFDPFPVLAL